MKAMILAAGLGTRLTPLTLDVPKPLIPVMNRPIIERLLQKLYSVGVREVVINTHHIPERIERDVPLFLHEDMSVVFSYEPEILGSAGGLKKVQSFFDRETFLLVNGDIYFDFDLNEGMAAHRKMGGVATLILKENEDVHRYGAIGTGKNGEISLFPYGVSRGESSRVGIFCGIHILEPEVFDFIPPDTFFCINQNVYPPMIHAGRKICGYFPSIKYWKDLGTLSEYLQVHWDILSGKIGIGESRSFSPGDYVHYGQGSRIDGGVRFIPPVWIGDRTVIKSGGCIGPYVVLGREDIVESGVEISYSIIWNNVTIEKGAKLNGAVLSHKVQVKENVSVKRGEVIREHTLVTVS